MNEPEMTVTQFISTKGLVAGQRVLAESLVKQRDEQWREANAGSLSPTAVAGDALDSRHPLIVAIIGSSRFKDFHMGHAQRVTLAGGIALVTGFWHHVDKVPLRPGDKERIDALMLAKIELADTVLVVNHHGYIGESTEKGIAHARKLGKPVSFTDPVE